MINSVSEYEMLLQERTYLAEQLSDLQNGLSCIGIQDCDLGSLTYPIEDRISLLTTVINEWEAVNGNKQA